jgi:hypothetical protein
MKWLEGAKQGIVVAGSQGYGKGLTQLSYPWGVVVDQLGTVYVAETGADRITCWVKGATQGSVIVGGNGVGGQSNELKWPVGLSFDRHGNLYVVDNRNQYRFQCIRDYYIVIVNGEPSFLFFQSRLCIIYFFLCVKKLIN